METRLFQIGDDEELLNARVFIDSGAPFQINTDQNHALRGKETLPC